MGPLTFLLTKEKGFSCTPITWILLKNHKTTSIKSLQNNMMS